MKALILILTTFCLGSQAEIFPHKEGKLYGYVNSEVEWKIKPKFQYASSFKHNSAIACLNNSWGLINRKGHFIKPPIYQNLQRGDHLILAQKKATFGYIDSSGQEKIPFIYQNASPFQQGHARVLDDRGWNLIDRQGNKVLSSAARELKVWKNGFIAYSRNDLWGLMNSSAQVIREAKYQSIKPLSKRLILFVDTDDQESLFDVKQKKFCSLDSLRSIPNLRLIAIQKEKLWGVWSYNKEEILRPIFARIHPFKEGMAVIQTVDNQYGFINQKARVIIPPNYSQAQHFHAGKALVQQNNKWFFINKHGWPEGSPTQYASKAQKQKEENKETSSTYIYSRDNHCCPYYYRDSYHNHGSNCSLRIFYYHKKSYSKRYYIKPYYNKNRYSKTYKKSVFNHSKYSHGYKTYKHKKN